MRTEEFVRMQIEACRAYYMQNRPGSRAAAEAAKHMGELRCELARLIRLRRALRFA